MKKIILFAAIALVGSTFTSCKKDYTCTCTVSATGMATTKYTYPLTNTTKSDATSACSALQSSAITAATAAGGGATVGYSASCGL